MKQMGAMGGAAQFAASPRVNKGSTRSTNGVQGEANGGCCIPSKMGEMGVLHIWGFKVKQMGGAAHLELNVKLNVGLM